MAHDPNNNNNNNTAKMTTYATSSQDDNTAAHLVATQRVGRRKRPVLTLRFVIGMLTAAIVVVVAGTTFAITYASTLSTVDSIGRRYASAVVGAGRNDVEAYFSSLTSNVRGIAHAMRAPWVRVPSEDPTNFTVLNRTNDLLLHTTLSTPESIKVVTAVFDDGSHTYYTSMYRDDVLNSISVNMLGQTTRCCGIGWEPEFFKDNLTIPRNRLTPANGLISGHFDGYAMLKSLVQHSSTGLWVQPALYTQELTSVRSFLLQLLFPIRNASNQYVAFLGIGVDLDRTSRFLDRLEVTENSEVFLLDGVPSIIATSHERPFVEYTTTTSASLTFGPHCDNSADFATPNETEFLIGCRATPASYGYAPLAELAAVDPAMLEPTAGSTVVTRFRVDGAQYYAVSTGLTNSERAFKLSLLLVMPEKDILGDVVTARNMVIGVICAVTVVFSAVSAIVVSVVLQPLSRVSGRMRRTARLRDSSSASVNGGGGDGDMEGGFSRLEEIHDLEDAYRTMNTAIHSFTRYVPRDVVKDLMATGQLCAIRMDPKQCTMLFVDIAGFTSMCERVDPSELSALVRSYFECMSSVTMAHGGLIDKFIGDCIMAVWGAPFPCGNPELKATLCAMRMQRETRVEPLVSTFDAAGELLNVRVGVSTGAVLAGNMGSAERMSYTVIGDDVNLAARLESLNRQLGTRVMLCQTTAAAVEPVIALRLLMAIRVVGKDSAVRVYEPIGVLSGDAGPQTLDQGVTAIVKQKDVAAVTGTSAADDRVSVVSDAFSTVSARADEADHRAAVDAVRLLEEALRLPDRALRATPQMIDVAAEHSAAVELFIRGDFGGAAAKVRGLLDRTSSGKALGTDASPHERDWLGHTAPAEWLAQLCESFARDPPAGFDGAWSAVEK